MQSFPFQSTSKCFSVSCWTNKFLKYTLPMLWLLSQSILGISGNCFQTQLFFPSSFFRTSWKSSFSGFVMNGCAQPFFLNIFFLVFVKKKTQNRYNPSTKAPRLDPLIHCHFEYMYSNPSWKQHQSLNRHHLPCPRLIVKKIWSLFLLTANQEGRPLPFVFKETSRLYIGHSGALGFNFPLKMWGVIQLV